MADFTFIEKEGSNILDGVSRAFQNRFFEA